MNRILSIACILIISVIICSCHKDTPLPDELRYTARMAGMHSWYGIRNDSRAGSNDTVTDTFAIMVIDKATITLGSYDLKYQSVNKDAKTIFFSGSSSSGSGFYTTSSSSGITYKYDIDSIYYYNNWSGPGLGYGTSLLHTP